MYGSTMNWSLTENDGQYELGINYKDSSGIDINRNVQSDNFSQLVSDTIHGFKNEYTKQAKQLNAAKEAENKKAKEAEVKKNEKDDYTAKLEKIIQELSAENKSLKANNRVLQERVDKVINKKSDKANVEQPNNPFEEMLKLFF